MCSEGRRIESRSVCLTQPNQNYPKKNFRAALLQQILNASKPRGLMTEINVCKTIRQKIYAIFYDMKCSKCSDVWIWTSTIMLVTLFWHQQTYTVFSVLVLCTMYSTFTFHCILTCTMCRTFHTVISMFPFLCC